MRDEETEIRERVGAMLLDESDVDTWMQQRSEHLGGKSPHTLIVDGRAGEVLDLIEAMETGSFL